jgi:UDP-3-O-[3-hydroxymyristoyl] glucosamine N-acyltransferase
MAIAGKELTLSSIARVVGGEISGDKDVRLRGVASLEKAGPSDLSFLASSKYLPALHGSAAGAVVCPRGVSAPGKNLLHVRDPHLAFGIAVEMLCPSPSASWGKGVHPTALLGEGVQLGKGVAIGPYVTVGDGVTLEDGVVVGPLVSIGENSEVGASSWIGPRVTIYPGVRIGCRCTIHAGTVLGGDGFGFAKDEKGRHRKIPQVGRLILGDDVEVGSNCAIDRGSLDDTVIGRGTKLDNLIHVAHNVRIGEDSLLVAQVGIAGSTVVGSKVVLAGQAGIVGHIEIGDGAVVGAQAGVVKSVKAGQVVSGYPARPHKKALKIQAGLVKIPQILRKVEELEERIARLEQGLTDRQGKKTRNSA